MKIKFIKPSYSIETPSEIMEGFLSHIERAGRTCYKSEDKITDDSAKEFVRKIIKLGHESVIEHCSITARFICDRGVTHELVRHRLASFSQESTRYVNYGKMGIEFIIPEWCTNIQPGEHDISDLVRFSFHTGEAIWAASVYNSAMTYNKLLELGWSPQQARGVLPNSLKTEIVVTANLREWRTIGKQRRPKGAHPQMREIMIPFFQDLNERIPVVFEDIVNI